MLHKFFLPLLAAVCYITPLQAQENAVAEEAPALPSPTMTADEIVAAQKPLMKTLNRTARSMEPQDARRMVDTVSTLEKIKTRRHNRTASQGEQIVYTKPYINTQNSKKVESYLKDKFLAPTDAPFENTETE